MLCVDILFGTQSRKSTVLIATLIISERADTDPCFVTLWWKVQLSCVYMQIARSDDGAEIGCWLFVAVIERCRRCVIWQCWSNVVSRVASTGIWGRLCEGRGMCAFHRFKSRSLCDWSTVIQPVCLYLYSMSSCGALYDQKACLSFAISLCFVYKYVHFIVYVRVQNFQFTVYSIWVTSVSHAEMSPLGSLACFMTEVMRVFFPNASLSRYRRAGILNGSN
jgi:hypothetical protein